MSLPKNDCILSIPYPEVTNPEKDVSLASRISSLYAGRYGEFTAVSAYSYQHVILKESSAYISDIIECISLVEMRHFEMLGMLINALGGDPVIGENERRRTYYWNGAYVNYVKNPQKILSDNIKAEQRAIADYSAVRDSTSNEQIKALLQRIILDEEHHIKLFKSLLNEI